VRCYLIFAAVTRPRLSSCPHHHHHHHHHVQQIGQANAVSDKLLDLRKCTYAGKDLRSTVLAGALMSEADFSGANMQVRAGVGVGGMFWGGKAGSSW